MGKLILGHLHDHYQSHYSDLSLTQHAALCRIGVGLYEYLEPFNPERVTKDTPAKHISEIHATRWTTWESRSTLARRFGMSTGSLRGVDRLVEHFHRTGDLRSKLIDATPGKERVEHTLVDRVACQVRLDGVIGRAIRALEEAEVDLPPVIDGEDGPASARDAVEQLIDQYRTAFVYTYRDRVYEDADPNDGEVADALPGLVEQYAGVAVSRKTPALTVVPEPDDGIVDAEVVDDEPDDLDEMMGAA